MSAVCTICGGNGINCCALPNSIQRPIECRLTAEEKLLFQAVLETVDDEKGDYAWMFADSDEAHANESRLQFADAIIDRLRVLKTQDMFN